MGNCTRCDSIIENLLKSNIKIHILTCGNGLKYFENNNKIASLTSMESFHYGSKEGKLSIAQTLLSIPQYFKLYRRKARQLTQLLQQIKPDIAITDSEYAVLPLKKYKIPVVGINNSDVVVSEYLRRCDLPKSIRFQFWFVEFMDFIYHRFLCDHVISPSITPTPTCHPKFKRVGLIVRQQVLDIIDQKTNNEHKNNEPLKLIVMLSGSEFASKINFDAYDLPYQVEVIGRTGSNQKNVIFHGRLWNNIKELSKADLLVINGGFSAVSEAFILEKYTLVIPVPGHAEQHINAVLLQEAGLGEMATEENVKIKLRELHEAWGKKNIVKTKSATNTQGAKEAADIILSIMQN